MHITTQQISAAADQFRAHILKDPTAADAPWLKYAGCQILMGDYRRGLPAIGSRLALQPDDPVAMNDLSDAMTSLGDGPMAAKWAQRGVQAAPDYLPAWIGLGNGLMIAERPQEAVAAYAVALDSPIFQRDPRLLCNAGLALLSIGNLHAWWMREHRFEGNPSLIPRRRWRDRPYWRGESLTDKTIVVWPEQGIGDEIVFATCFADLAARAGRVIVQCDRRLLSLYRRSFGRIANLEFAADPGPLWAPPSDYTVASGSLGAYLRPTLGSFPAQLQQPLRPEWWNNDIQSSWLFNLGAHWEPKEPTRVGICWRSILTSAARDQHYLTLGEIAPLLDVEGIQFVSLQHGASEAEREILQHFNVALPDHLDLKDDFEGTAALLANLDAVIGPGTTMTTLAAALGVRTWMLAPRQDWMRLGTGGYPWLPAARAFPKGPAGWPAEVAAVEAGLRALRHGGEVVRAT